MHLQFPFCISPRLLVAVNIGTGTVSICKHQDDDDNSMPTWSFYVDDGDLSFEEENSGNDYVDAFKWFFRFQLEALEDFHDGLRKAPPGISLEWVEKYEDEITAMCVTLDTLSEVVAG